MRCLQQTSLRKLRSLSLQPKGRSKDLKLRRDGYLQGSSVSQTLQDRLWQHAQGLPGFKSERVPQLRGKKDMKSCSKPRSYLKLIQFAKEIILLSERVSWSVLVTPNGRHDIHKYLVKLNKFNDTIVNNFGLILLCMNILFVV